MSNLIQQLRSLKLPTEDFAIFGSGPLYARGLAPLGHDLDIICRGTAWEKAQTLGIPSETRSGNGMVVTLFEGTIELFNDWGPGDWDVEKLIDEGFEHEGLRYVQLEQVLAWKSAMGREKDQAHISRIRSYLNTS